MTSPIVTADDVAELRAIADAGLTAKCTVYRGERTPGPGGSGSTSFGVVAGLVDLPCGFRAEAPAAGVAADAPTTRQRYRVRFGGALVSGDGAVILPYDRLLIVHTERGVASPLILSVVGLASATSYGDEVTRLIVADAVGSLG